MSRTPRNEVAVRDFAKAIQKVIRAHGQAPGPKAIELAIYRDHGFHVSDESIRKALAGQIDPNGCSLELLAGLAAYFGVPHAALGEFAARRLNAVFALVGGDAPNPPSGGGRGTDGESEQAAGGSLCIHPHLSVVPVHPKAA